jgi:hypothetical protein
VATTRIRLSRMDYNEAPEAFLILLMNAKTIESKNLTLEGETPKVMWALWVSWCNLVPQLPRVVTFAYDLCFRCVIARWKGLSESYTFYHQTLTPSTV